MSKPKVGVYTMSTSINQLERIKSALEKLELTGILTSFETVANRFIKDHSSPFNLLESLLEKQMTWKEETRINLRMQLAKFPFRKTLDDFNFSFQPSINQRQIRDLANCRFVENGENIIFYGTPGGGKTHLAVALGIEAIKRGHNVKCLNIDWLNESVEKTGGGEALIRLFRNLFNVKLLIFDDIDIYTPTEETDDLLYRLLRRRYEAGLPHIFTSNKSFEGWSKLFRDPAKVGTLVDRIASRSIPIIITGESYRMTGKRK